MSTLSTGEQLDMNRHACTEPLAVCSIIEAIYEPDDPIHAQAWAEHLIGRRSRWLVSFVIQDGLFAGQWAVSPYPLIEGPAGYWVPLLWLRDVRLLGELFDDEL